jgi:hypothetical protein
MVGSWLSFYVDGQLVNSFYDFNNSYSSGYIGFRALENSVFTIKNFKSRLLYPQIPSYGLNPGDDIDSSIGHLQSIQRAWFFSDLFGRFKGTLLKSNDAPNYTYVDQLYSQKTDESDKESVNQVSVIGSNVSAIAKNSESIGSTVGTRDSVVVDYKITSLGDAQSRAQNELNDANKFTVQADPEQMINVGAELFDVVNIVNTGPNSSAFDADLRVYNQSIEVDGRTSKYSLKIGTGNII